MHSLGPEVWQDVSDQEPGHGCDSGGECAEDQNKPLWRWKPDHGCCGLRQTPSDDAARLEGGGVSPPQLMGRNCLIAIEREPYFPILSRLLQEY